jgi:hypothetical protein
MLREGCREGIVGKPDQAVIVGASFGASGCGSAR